MDVFISYSSKNKDWVRGVLLKRIEQTGLKAFIDYRDFARGAPSLKEMERGVKACRKTLLVLTPEYIESEWCEIEAIMGQTHSPANRDLRLIPLLKADCEKPLRIGALTHIDFTKGADEDLAWRQLLTALGKQPEPEPLREPERDHWFLAHPYPMPPNFTGRRAERDMLSRWLETDGTHPLFVLRALGGFGKSALTWHWLMHDVPPADWPHVAWWSFYEADASFERFVAETLDYLGEGGVDSAERSPKEAVRALVQALRSSGTILVLDGFERVLRAFGGLDAAYQGDEAKREAQDRDCVSPLAEWFLRTVVLQPGLRSKVLLTTRLRPRVLEAKGGELLRGCREERLEQLQPADAVAYFHARGIRGTHTEIERVCAPYGYHPLSLCLLAGLIVGDFEQPGDVAAAKRLDVSGDLVQQQHHVLEAAFDRLAPPRRLLLCRIACFRSPVRYAVLQALAEGDTATPPDADLRGLVGRGLVYHDTRKGRFDLHPIVRRYAYDRLAAPDRSATHTQLRDYFAAVPPPDQVTRLVDLTPVIELYHHTVRAGQLDEACDLFDDRLHTPLYYQFGAYQLCIDLLRTLFPDSEGHPPRLKNERDQAWTLNMLANAYSLSGQPRRAVPLYEQQISIAEKLGDKKYLAIGLSNVADDQLKIGALRTAEANLRRSIALCQEIGNEFLKAAGTKQLGRPLAYSGAYAASEQALSTALEIGKKQNNIQGQGLIWAYRAQRELLRMRSDSAYANHTALKSARRALELANEKARTDYPVERDYVRAHWLLGAAHRVAGQLGEAERHLHEALGRCRRINMVDHEADILIDLAWLHAATGAEEEAQHLAEEALIITERSGYVLQGADAHLELARLAMARGERVSAKEHAEEALRLATCDGPPDYTYKAAYDEARVLLADLSS